jgi:hypothetical protein
MRKLKVTLMAMAIVLGVGGAIASAPPAPPCERLVQYYDTGLGWYDVAGVEGVDFVCAMHWTKVCTYTKTPNGFVPCKRGEILWLQ